MASPYITTFNSGIDPTPPGGTQMTFTVGGAWVAGDKWSIIITDVSGSVTIGTGTIFQTRPVAALTLANKVYFVSGQTLYFSAIGDPQGWDPQDVGSGFIIITTRSASSEDLVGLASYQGRLSVFSKRSVQIWTVDADPAKYALNQTLSNIGTAFTESIKSYGDMDVYFVAKTGTRSLRVRDSSLNAFVSDAGSPVDLLIQGSLKQQETSGRIVCGVLEPDDNRYWVFIHDTIYVLSYFPSSKVAAWSTYAPTYDKAGVQTAFQPVKFVVSDEIVWCRAVDGAVYIFGGLGGTTYDTCTSVGETPWLDVKKPATVKISQGVDMSSSGNWVLKGSTDYKFRASLNMPTSFVDLLTTDSPSFDDGRIPWTCQGTHFKLRAECSDASPSTLSMLIWHYKEGNEK